MKQAGLESALSMALYLQGGPGFGAPTPICGWDSAALGRSSVVRGQLEARARTAVMSNYVKH